MLKEEVKAIMEREPFKPFAFHLTNGTKYKVKDPLGARFLGYAVLYFIGHKVGTNQAKSYDRFPFEQIERIEDLNNGGGRKRKKAS